MSLDKASTAHGMEISAEKTKLMTNNTSGINTEITVNGKKLETVTSFKYLGSFITDEVSKPEILSRIAQTTATLILQHACESWTLTADLQRRIQAMEMRCYHKILHISYKDEEVHAKIQQAIGPHEDLIIIKRCKLQHFKEMQTAAVWSCLRFIRSGQNHLARHSERGKKTRQTEEEVERQHQGRDRPGVRQVPEGSQEAGKWRKWLQNHLWCANDPHS